MQLIFQHVRRLDVHQIAARRGQIDEQRQPAEVNESLAGVRGIVMNNCVDSIVSAPSDSRWRPASAKALYTLSDLFSVLSRSQCTLYLTDARRLS